MSFDKADQMKRYEEDLENVSVGNPIIFAHKGFLCAIVRQELGHLCGYVRIGSLTIDADDIDVHGGVTFKNSDIIHLLGNKGGGNWIGFDCAHAFDFAPKVGMFSSYEVYRDSEYVRKNIIDVVDQILERIKK